MAIQFEQQRASLIRDLPTANARVAVPDIRQGFDQAARAVLSVDAQRQEQKDRDTERRRRQDDRLAGLAAGGKAAAIGPDGKYVPVQLPDGSPEYRDAYLEAATANYDAAFETDLINRFNRIQNDPAIQDADKPKMMQAALEGAASGVPEYRRAQYLQWGAGQLSQRSTYIASDMARKNEQVLVSGLETIINDGIEKGAAAAAAGADPSSFQGNIDRSYDQLVQLKRISPEAAAKGKADSRNLMAAMALSDDLTTRLFNGEIDAASLDQFADTLEAGGETEILVTTEDEMGRRGRGVKGYRSSDVIKRITDPRVRGELAQNFRKAAATRRQHVAAMADGMELQQAFEAFGGQNYRFMTLPSNVKDKYELFGARLMADNTPESGAVLLESMKRFRVAPKAVTNSLVSMLYSGDQAQVDKAVQMFHQIKTLQNEYGDEVGRDIVANMTEEDANKLNAAWLANELGYPASDIQAAYRKLTGPDAPSLSDSIRVYNEIKGDEAGFTKSMRADWAGRFGGPIPFDAEEKFKRAYRISLAITGDAEKAYADAMERTSTAYTASKIFTTGWAKTAWGTLTNPPGYDPKRKNMFGGAGYGTDYDWLEDFIRADLSSGRSLVLEGDLTREELNRMLAPGNDKYGPEFLGRTMFLEPTDTNVVEPEYRIRMLDPEGNDMGYMQVEGKDGQPRYLTINPHAEHRMWANQYAAKEARTAAQERASRMENELRLNTLGKITGGRGAPAVPPSDAMLDKYLETAEPGIQEQYKLELGRIRENLKRELEKADETVSDVKPSRKSALDKSALLTPRASGYDVAAAAVSTIEDILPDGTGGVFMMRVAAQESRFGTAAGTFRPKGDKGIFQINTPAGAWPEVKRQVALGSGPVFEAHEKVKQELGIDVAELSVEDLDKPIVNAVVARLYLETKPPIPEDLEGQARWWKRHYNTYLGSGTPEEFVRSARKVPDDFRVIPASYSEDEALR